MAYFRCTTSGSGGGTLTVTCADDFAGATITCSKSGTTLSKVCPSTSPYEVVFNIPESGTWTVSGTIDNVPYSTTVEIDLDYTAELANGFVWETWVDTSSLLDSSDYASLAELLADEEAIRELCTEHATVDYMCEQADVNEDLATVIANDLFAKWANLRDYCLDMMYANEAISDEMDDVGKYGFGEWALMPQVPTMTSNTAPYGTASAESNYSSSYAYKAFDNDPSTAWENLSTSTSVGSTKREWLQYEFVSAVTIKSLSISLINSNYPLRRIEVFGSNDGSTFGTAILDKEYTGSIIDANENFNNSVAYRYYRVYVTTVNNGTSATNIIRVKSLQFYAWAPKGNVPVMTSNTAPYGEVIYSNYDGSSYPYLAFDGNDGTIWGPKVGDNTPYLGYKFTNPVCVRRVSYSIRNSNAVRPVRTIVVQGSNDNSTWEDLGSFDLPGGADPIFNTVDVSNTEYYLYYRLYCSQALNVQSSWWYPFMSLQFYGRELSVSVPVMTSDTAPYGEAAIINNTSGRYAYYAFDNNTSTFVDSSANNVEWYVLYKFPSPICLKKVSLLTRDSYNNAQVNVVQVSNDGTTWETINDIDLTRMTASNTQYVFDTQNNNSGLYVRIYNASIQSGGYNGFKSIQFYGLDYSEKEFETGATKKWLYDHGVELETIEKALFGNATATNDGTSYNLVGGSSSNQYSAVMSSQDLADKSLIRAKIYNMVTNVGCTCGSALTSYSTIYDTGYKTFNSGDGNLPNNLYLDISAVTQTKYIGCYVGNSASASVTEMWLE